MKIYIKLFFSSEGPDPLEVLKKVKDIGFKPVFGQYDLTMEVRDIDEYIAVVRLLHASLKGTKVMYNLTSTNR